LRGSGPSSRLGTLRTGADTTTQQILRDIAQLGQSAAFGMQKSLVRIQLSRQFGSKEIRLSFNGNADVKNLLEQSSEMRVVGWHWNNTLSVLNTYLKDLHYDGTSKDNPRKPLYGIIEI
jgi:hypothetical protein